MPTWQPQASLATLQKRAELYATIRRFFAEQHVLEVDTPLLAEYGVTDPYVDNITVDIDQQRYYLQTSPEYAIKRLLAAGLGDCYQLGKAFRHEDEGQHHRREFTMLEWYRCGWHIEQLIQEIIALLQACGAISAASQIQQQSYTAWFTDVLQLNPITTCTADIQRLTSRYGVDATTLSRDECLDLLMVSAIEPELAQIPVAIMTDFPASRAALAQLNPNNPTTALRFELYLHGIELANGYQELTNATQLEQRSYSDLTIRQQLGKPSQQLDPNLLAAMQHGLPHCAGVALGIDRLLMAILNLDTIDETML